MINNITDYGNGTIRTWYDHLVVHVTNITGSPNSTSPNGDGIEDDTNVHVEFSET